jgi:hypothetical protein
VHFDRFSTSLLTDNVAAAKRFDVDLFGFEVTSRASSQPPGMQPRLQLPNRGRNPP